MQRRSVDSLEVQQMKAQAREEKERKQVNLCAQSISVGLSCRSFWFCIIINLLCDKNG